MKQFQSGPMEFFQCPFCGGSRADNMSILNGVNERLYFMSCPDCCKQWHIVKKGNDISRYYVYKKWKISFKGIKKVICLEKIKSRGESE